MKNLCRLPLLFALTASTLLIPVSCGTPCRAAENRSAADSTPAAKKTAGQPKPRTEPASAAHQQDPPAGWGGPPVWTPYEKFGAVLRSWARLHPETMTVEPLGPSREGRTVYAVTLTDPSVGRSESSETAVLVTTTDTSR